jgi:hypothetical protein
LEQKRVAQEVKKEQAAATAPPLSRSKRNSSQLVMKKNGKSLHS